MSEFSTRFMRQVIQDNTDKRISDKAADELAEILEEFAGNIAELSIQEAEKRDRLTIKDRDIREVLDYSSKILSTL